MNTKRLLAFIMSAILIVGLAACGGGGGGNTATQAPTQATAAPATEAPATAAPATEAQTAAAPATDASGEAKTIGFSVYDLQYEFFQLMEAGTKAQVEALGYKYQFHDQKGDETEMVTGAINLINSGIAALVISPCKPEALSSIVAAAKEKGVPVVVDDIGGGGADYNAIVISNCYEGGQQAADYTALLLKGNEGSKKVAIIKCEPEAVYAIRRGEGYKANITAAGFNVVAEVSGHSKSEEGYSIMQDLMASNPDLVAVFAENDPMAVGAANALADAGRNDVVVVGFNNDPEAVDAMKNGILAATIAQYPADMGKLTVDLADKFIKGQPVDFDNSETREIFANVKLIRATDVGGPAPNVGGGGGGGVSKGVIGFSVYDMQYEFFQIMELGTKKQVEDMGYGYVLHDQKGDETEMVTGAINLINSGVKALIISPCKPEALSSIVAAAKEKGVPVVVDDIGGGGADYNAIVISNCYEGGQQAADYTAELLQGNEGSRKVAIIKCEPEAVYAIRRGEGYKANITAAGYNVVAEVSGHSKSEEGYSIMQDLLASNPDLVAVFAENDPMAVGAANALADAVRDDIVVVGFNNDPEAVDAMKNGILAATIAQYPGDMGKLTVVLADKFINGEPVTFDNPETREIFADVKLIKASDVK